MEKKVAGLIIYTHMEGYPGGSNGFHGSPYGVFVAARGMEEAQGRAFCFKGPTRH